MVTSIFDGYRARVTGPNGITIGATRSRICSGRQTIRIVVKRHEPYKGQIDYPAYLQYLRRPITQETDLGNDELYWNQNRLPSN